MGSDTIAAALRAATGDDRARAIVLRVNSPGGSYVASDTIWREVVRARGAGKPVVVSMGDVAASGGYYISMAADAIVAQPGTLTGSIGVIISLTNVRGLMDKLGVEPTIITAGRWKDTGSPFRAVSPEERAKFEGWIKTTYYEDFIPKVAKGRKKDAQAIDAVGQGRVWTGAQAKDRGLVDEFGGLDKAIEVAKQLANIPADKGVQRVILPYPQTFLQQILSGGGENSNTKVEQQRAA
jgi:protease-4